jgi:hypothetical protein
MNIEDYYCEVANQEEADEARKMLQERGQRIKQPYPVTFACEIRGKVYKYLKLDSARGAWFVGNEPITYRATKVTFEEWKSILTCGEVPEVQEFNDNYDIC